ncbi:MAG: hypothetical protein ACJ76H_05130 [Bacteriovoracaceae bacterium]
MQWADISNIILPLFISNAMPLEKERDTTLSLAHQKVIEYCRDTPLGKMENSSYVCRIQIESDCKDFHKEKACDLLTKLKDWEQSARDKQIAAREKKKETMFWCVVAPPRISPPADVVNKEQPVRLIAAVIPKIKLEAGSLNMDGDLSWTSKYSIGIQEKINRLISLGGKIRLSDLTVNCSEDSQCKVQGMGDKGCGGFVSSIYYSGSPAVISDILEFNKLDDELNNLLQFGSTCEYHQLYQPVCQFNRCGPGQKPIAP